MNLIIPSVSCGNIPQLTVDLLIHSLDFQLVSRLDDSYLHPFASPVDHVAGQKVESGHVATAIELYRSQKLDTDVLQIRSPPIADFKRAFAAQLEELTSKYTNIIVLGSSDAGLREQVGAPKIEYYTSDLATRFQTLSLDGPKVKEVPAVLPGSGYFRSLVKGPALGLVFFAYEGDNFGDAHQLADAVVKLLGAEEQKWTQPVSWQGAYGHDAPIGVEQGVYC
ncbi:hypothetical protein CJU90_4562 [Yarrowia sp. C11]|nr:hypothetical protein CJU90_4562 [Yarrowia sp. C11]KAG5370509.1 hypothetical protein CKK34_0611 [Yarrowia sp. E02]